MEIVEEAISSKISPFQFLKTAAITDLQLYNKYVNWVAGEFDLYLMSGTRGLKVYFPNGWFSIRNINIDDAGVNLEIKVEGKSKTACKKVISQLQNVYDGLTHFVECSE